MYCSFFTMSCSGGMTRHRGQSSKTYDFVACVHERVRYRSHEVHVRLGHLRRPREKLVRASGLKKAENDGCPEHHSGSLSSSWADYLGETVEKKGI